MSLNKERAYKALANRIRQRYDMSYDADQFFAESAVKEFGASVDPRYKSFAEVYFGELPSYGGHPDYDYLKEPDNVGKSESGVITALFMDLKNFTKYCRFIEPEKVYKAKGAAIEAVAAVCRIYGGHLHEIPGDGVLVYFGGKNQDTIETANLAIQAAADAMKFLEAEIIPEYNNDGDYPDIFPKMGVDFGTSLWAAYGASPNYEVKATSFNVDIAAKMMGGCNAREIRIGDDIKNHLDIEDDYVEDVKQPYEKQHTIRGETKKISYKIWKFNWQKFLTGMMRENPDLAKLGLFQSSLEAPRSRTKLNDAPLA